MDQTANGNSSGHMKSFWPLTVIFVVAVIAAGLVYWFQINLEMDYDLQSMVLTVHRRGEAPSVPVKPGKTSAGAATGTPSQK